MNGENGENAESSGEATTLPDSTPVESVPAPDPDEPPIDGDELLDEPSDLGPDVPACVGDDWYTVEAGDFTYFVPGDLVDQQVQGIDSLVLEHARPGLTVTADVGWFGSSFAEFEELGATLEPITVGDHEGFTVNADLRDFPDYGGGYIVGVYLAPIGAGGGDGGDGVDGGEDRAAPEFRPDPQPEQATHLTLSIHHDDEADAADAACIAASTSVA